MLEFRISPQRDAHRTVSCHKSRIRMWHVVFWSNILEEEIFSIYFYLNWWPWSGRVYWSKTDEPLLLCHTLIFMRRNWAAEL